MWWRWLQQARTWRWFCIAAIARIALFWIFIHEHGLHQSWWGWGSENGDTEGYFNPIDSYLHGEAYRPDARMPGYGLPYLLGRLITTPAGAGTMVLFLQLALSTISVVALGRCARLLRIGTLWTEVLVIGYACCAPVALYDVAYYPESLATSAIILATHGWLAWRREGGLLTILWAGSWLAWAVFMKPVLILWVAVLVVHMMLGSRVRHPQRLIPIFVLLVPFLLADGWWMQRNFRMHGRAHPFTSTTWLPSLRSKHFFPVITFMQATGGSHTWWDGRADIRWFNVRDGALYGPGKRMDRDLHLPTYALGPRCTTDSLLALAGDLRQWNHRRTTPVQRRALIASIRERADRFTRYYREDRQWQYHVMSRVRLSAFLFNGMGARPMFERSGADSCWWRCALNASGEVWYRALVPLALLAAIVLLFRGRKEVRVIAIAVLLGVLIFPVMRLCETRYLVPLLPWCALLLVVAVENLVERRSVRIRTRTSIRP